MDIQKKEMLKAFLPMDDLAELLEEMGFVRATHTTPTLPTLPEKEEPKADVFELLSDWLGVFGGDAVYLSKTGDCYYLVTSTGYLFPRGTNMGFESQPGTKKLPVGLNPSPERGGLGVPKKYTLPTGYQWRTVPGDGAYYIIKSDQVLTDGPSWLASKTEPAPSNAGHANTEKSTGWELENDK